MLIILDEDDLDRLRSETKADLLKLLAQKAVSGLPPSVAEASPVNYDYKGLVDLDLEQTKELMKGLSKIIKDGLHVIAEHEQDGVSNNKLKEVWNENLSMLKACTTKRVRTITGAKDAFLMNYKTSEWDKDGKEVDWKWFVTPKTWQSLRGYFGI